MSLEEYNKLKEYSVSDEYAFLTSVKSLYKSTPKAVYLQTEMIQAILEECWADEEKAKKSGIKPPNDHTCKGSVLNWLNGRNKPDPFYFPAISRATGVKYE